MKDVGLTYIEKCIECQQVRSKTSFPISTLVRGFSAGVHKDTGVCDLK